MEKRWEIINKTTADGLQTPEDILDVLLENRGITTKKAKDEFLNPPKLSTYSAVKLGIKKGQLLKAIKRVKEAVKQKEQILVYGDYDADGICSTAILWEALDSLGAKATPYIPSRFEDGYGINLKTVKRLKRKHKNLSLIITVDNGIVAFDAVECANELGIDVIITDHHEPKEKMPKAFGIVHTVKTSGSGVAWLFSRELIKKNGNAIELAAIGTIADQLPLVGFNRSIAKYGLEYLSKTTRIGLRKLFATAGLLEKPIGTYEVNFQIAPRINASGRMAEGMDALRLLCTRSPGRAQKLAVQLNKLNMKRQKVVDDAIKIVEGSFSQEKSVLILYDEKYHEGVIGLIAGRLTEKYYKPAIVMSVKDDIAKASARSVTGFNIVEAIRASEELILEGGGHAMAAGFSIEVENIEKFSKKINKYSEPLLTSNVLDRKQRIDCLLHFSLINQKVYNTLSQLEPFGIGNPAPVFATKKARVVSQKLVGNGRNHLKLTLEEDVNRVDGIFFNRDSEIKNDLIDVSYRLSENSWNGNTNIEIMIKDIKEKN